MTETCVDCSLLACSSTAKQQCSDYKWSAAVHIARRCPGSHRLSRRRLTLMLCFHTRSQLFSQVPQSWTPPVPVVQPAQANAMLLHRIVLICAGSTVFQAFRADPGKSIMDHLLEVSKVADGLRAQDIDKLRESERSLQHYADDLRVHTLYRRAASAKKREHARRDGKRKLEGMFCACCANDLLQCASAMCVNDEVCCCQGPEH